MSNVEITDLMDLEQNDSPIPVISPSVGEKLSPTLQYDFMSASNPIDNANTSTTTTTGNNSNIDTDTESEENGNEMENNKTLAITSMKENGKIKTNCNSEFICHKELKQNGNSVNVDSGSAGGRSSSSSSLLNNVESSFTSSLSSSASTLSLPCLNSSNIDLSPNQDDCDSIDTLNSQGLFFLPFFSLMFFPFLWRTE